MFLGVANVQASGVLVCLFCDLLCVRVWGGEGGEMGEGGGGGGGGGGWGGGGGGGWGSCVEGTEARVTYCTHCNGSKVYVFERDDNSGVDSHVKEDVLSFAIVQSDNLGENETSFFRCETFDVER